MSSSAVSRRGVSTLVFLEQRLTPALLSRLHKAGAQAVEVFAARHHFDYTLDADRRELAAWLGDTGATALMHMPLFEGLSWTRHTAPSINLISPSKSVRITAMDEVKRALEAAEVVPFAACVLHLGMGDDRWSTETLDDALTAIEHLKAFAAPLGVKLLLENLPNEVATPAHLAEITRVGHFTNVGFCLSVGHANMEPAARTDSGTILHGIGQAFEAFGNRIDVIHLNDNHGLRDEHLFPGEGTADFNTVADNVAAHSSAPWMIVEPAFEFGHDTDTAITRLADAWQLSGA